MLTAVPCEDAGDAAAGGAGRVHEAGQLLGGPEDGARQQPVQRPAVISTSTLYISSVSMHLLFINITKYKYLHTTFL